MLGATGEQMAEELRSLLSPPDVAVITGDLSEYLLAPVFTGRPR